MKVVRGSMQRDMRCGRFRWVSVLLVIVLLSRTLCVLTSSSSFGSSNIGSVKAPGRLFMSEEVRALQETERVAGANLTVWYMEERMDDVVARFVFRNHRQENRYGVDFYQHDFVVVGFSHPGGTVWVKAEKGGDSRKGRADAGIYITREWTEPVGKIRYQSGSFVLGAGDIGLVIDILAGHERKDYNLFTANCWLYAYNSSMAILQWLSSQHGGLKQELERLMVAKRIMPHDLVHSFAHPDDPMSAALAQEFGAAVARTLTRFPTKAWKTAFLELIFHFVNYWFDLVPSARIAFCKILARVIILFSLFPMCRFVFVKAVEIPEELIFNVLTIEFFLPSLTVRHEGKRHVIYFPVVKESDHNIPLEFYYIIFFVSSLPITYCFLFLFLYRLAYFLAWNRLIRFSLRLGFPVVVLFLT